MNSPNPARDTRQRNDARVGKRPWKRKREFAESCKENGPSRESEMTRTPRRLRRIVQETPVNEPMPELENGPSRESEKTRTPRRIRRILRETPVNEPMAELENGPSRESEKTRTPRRIRRILEETPVNEPKPELENGPSRECPCWKTALESEKTRPPR